MNWKIIIKNAAQLPTHGNYNDWKPLLAKEGYNQCVYCAIHENLMGGIRNFHVEHYRPKSLFRHLENDYRNLFYACPICNTFKSNDWPNDPAHDNSIPSYPNPSVVDYNTLFNTDWQRGIVEGRNVAAKYMEEKMYLNRPQLISARRLHFIFHKWRDDIEEFNILLGKIVDDSVYREYSTAFNDLLIQFTDILIKIREISNYSTEDIQRNYQESFIQ